MLTHITFSSMEAQYPRDIHGFDVPEESSFKVRSSKLKLAPSLLYSYLPKENNVLFIRYQQAIPQLQPR